jgi:hypothetical protein
MWDFNHADPVARRRPPVQDFLASKTLNGATASGRGAESGNSIMGDRLEGVASLADFFSTNHAVGRYREATRFFEMAFALPISDVEKKLTQFLTSGPFGYTRKEVASWLLPRHGAVHGDRKKTTQLTWESDVRQYLNRIEQALLDILYNKQDWGRPSHTRREIWTPAYRTSSPDGGLSLTKGMAGTIRLQLLDAWHAFPHDLTASLDSPPPEWWCRIEQPAHTEVRNIAE